MTMDSFAIFRLPHADRCTLIKGDAVALPSLASLHRQQGFLLAPFAPSEEEPVLLIQPSVDSVECGADGLALQTLNSQLSTLNYQLSTINYQQAFSAFHDALLRGEFQKLVLARRFIMPHDGTVSPMTLFTRACQCYPRMFVALVSTPQSGTWLTASPEILLESIAPSRWRTIALAGTMRLRNDKADNEGQHLRWSAKNIQEQRYVASYIADVLRRFATNVSEEGPRTVRAGHLVHLRSDFTFTIDNNCTRAGELLDALHPTPAVCGLPKAEALDFILQHEQAPRHYYSGFMGPVNLNDNVNDNVNDNEKGNGTHLFVSLRCMQITGSEYHLYAGGGLLRESTEQQEWLETEAKMDTMRKITE